MKKRVQIVVTREIRYERVIELDMDDYEDICAMEGQAFIEHLSGFCSDEHEIDDHVSDADIWELE